MESLSQNKDEYRIIEVRDFDRPPRYFIEKKYLKETTKGFFKRTIIQEERWSILGEDWEDNSDYTSSNLLWFETLEDAQRYIKYLVNPKTTIHKVDISKLAYKTD